MQPVRSLTVVTLGALVIVGIVACSSGTTPGWTYAPPPTAKAAPSTAPGASAASSSAPAASAVVPSAATSPVASGAAAGPTVLNESAFNLLYQVLKLQAPAGQPFQIAFDNKDGSIQHNIQIVAAGGGPNLFEGELITGVAKTTYNVNPLTAGVYKYTCKIHPTTMVGELTVR